MSVQVLKQWNVEEVEAAVAISTDGRLALVDSGMKHSIDCIEVPTGAKTGSLEGHTSTVKALAIAPERRQGASGSEDGEIRLWELATGKLMTVLRGHSKRVTSIEYSNDGKYLLSGSWDNTCQLWDAQTLKLASTFRGHSAGVTGVSIAPDSKSAASSSFDYSVRVWEMRSGRCLEQLPGHNSKVICVSISGNGKRLVAGDAEGRLSVSDLPATKSRVVGPFPGPVHSVKLSKDGAKAYVGLSGGGFWSFDLQTQKATQLFELTGRFPAELPFGLHFAMSEDARYVVAARAASAAIVELERPASKISFFGLRKS